MYVNGPLVTSLTTTLTLLTRRLAAAGEPPLTSHHIPAKEFLAIEREIRQDPRWIGYRGFSASQLAVNGIIVQPFTVLEPSRLPDIETVEEYEARISHPQYGEFMRQTTREEAYRQAREATFDQAFDTWRRTGTYQRR